MSSIKYEVVGKVAVITIDRPEKMNALSLDNQYDLDAAWKQLKDDSRVVIGIITGSGQRAFCVGADLKDDKSLSDRNSGKPADYAEASLFPREYDLNKPVIAAINGHALGMGAASGPCPPAPPPLAYLAYLPPRPLSYLTSHSRSPLRASSPHL